MLVGLSVVATRLLVAPPGGADPLAVALLRNVVAVALTLALAPMLRVRGGADQAPAPGPSLRRDGPALALLGILGFCLFPFLFTAALLHAGAGQAALALPAIPMLTLLFAAVLGRERLTWRKAAGVALAGAGVCVALGMGASALPGATLAGGALMLGAAASSAGYNVLVPPLAGRHGTLTVVLSSMVAGTAALALLAAPGLLARLPSFDAAGWAALAFVGAASTGSNLLWTAALRVASPSGVAVFTTLNPVAAALGAAVLLGEPITASVLASFVLVAAGIVVVNAGGRS